MPKVTVLIPNYNGARFLEHCFQGLLSQISQNFRCIFLDDGSTDDSLKIAERFKIELPQLEIRAFENGGIATNWNRGIDLVETEYFTLLHCDDSYEPQYIEEMIRLLDAYPDSGLGHCASQAINDLSNPLFSITEFYKHSRFLPAPAFQRDISDEYGLLLMTDFINCPSVMYRTQAVQNIGKFDSALEQTLDWDYWFRCLRSGYKICGTNQKLYRYRRHTSNHTVVNSKNMKRYHEELTCLENAMIQGARLGLSSNTLETSGLSNIVIVDIASALRDGNMELVGPLLNFLREKLGANRITVALLMPFIVLKRLGGHLLFTVIRIIVLSIALRTNLLSWIELKRSTQSDLRPG